MNVALEDPLRRSSAPGPGAGGESPPDRGASPRGQAARPRSKREIYIDAFRGLMALVMVQGHVMDSLLTREVLQHPFYVFQQMFHGSTAPGFLFASGFVAGLPRSPLSVRASGRRARRLAFVLLVGYFLHLPYLSFWKTFGGTSMRELAQLYACDALHVIAVTQLFVLLLQWVAGRHWTRVAALLALAVVLATPLVWSSGLSARLHPALGAYVDPRSPFPIFPFSGFVLAGTLAGATLGRAEPDRRHRLMVQAGGALLAVGALLAWALAGRVEYWGPSPAYSFVRLGGLVLMLHLVERLSSRAGAPGIRGLALLGHETLLVYVLHLFLLFGGVLGTSPLARLAGQLGVLGATAVIVAMLPVLLATAWGWRQAKHRAPREAQLALVFLCLTFFYEFLVRPW